MKGKKITSDKKQENKKFRKITKKQRLQEKGITLIALVVTIIILLILAGVTLNIALSDNGLFGKVKKAAEDYKDAQNEEEDSLLEYEYEMAKLQGKISETETAGEYAMEKEIKEIYGQDIKIGDTVNYDPKIEESTYDGKWKVLGIEDGKILLVSSKSVDYLTLDGVEGYKTAIESLDNICKKYGKNTIAEEARSLRVEDINKITGYNPKKQVNGKIFGEGTLEEYNITINCEIKEDKIVYTGSNGIMQEIEGSFLINEDDNIANKNQKTSFENNFYRYMVAWGYMDMDRLENNDFEVHDQRWMNLFEEFGTSDTWLANQTYGFKDGDLRFDVRSLQCGMNRHNLEFPSIVASLTLFNYSGEEYSNRKAVHSVIRLMSNVVFNYNEDSRMWTIEE